MEDGVAYLALPFLAVAILVRVTMANFVREDAEYYERRAGLWWFLTLIGGELTVAVYRWFR